jgi:peroxiredoxin
MRARLAPRTSRPGRALQRQSSDAAGMSIDGGRTSECVPGAALSPGTAAPAFALHDGLHSSATLEDFRGRIVVLVFYGVDWHPVATAQLGLYQELLPHLERLGAVILGISVDGTWSHQEFARTTGIRFPLLSDDAPPGGVARAYGVDVPNTGRSQRALFVIDPDGQIQWSATFPDAVNPGADGMLKALEALRTDPLPRQNCDGIDLTRCPCGCGVSIELVGQR